MVYGARLESVYVETHRGFESHSAPPFLLICRFAGETLANPATVTAVLLCAAENALGAYSERVQACGKFDTAADIRLFFPCPDARPKIILCMRIQYPPRANMADIGGADFMSVIIDRRICLRRFDRFRSALL